MPLGAWAAPAPAWRDCPLGRAVYRDAGLQGFTLTFSEPRPSSESSGRLAQVTVRHAQKGIVSQWDLSHGLGYGSSDLSDPIGEDNGAHGVYAFDAKLQPLDAPHGAWLFVSGLGQSNWYSGRTGARDAPVLKDVMWAFVRCVK